MYKLTDLQISLLTIYGSFIYLKTCLKMFYKIIIISFSTALQGCYFRKSKKKIHFFKKCWW